MKITLKNIDLILIIVILLTGFSELKSQYQNKNVTEVYTIPNGDTIIMNRIQSEWWFGALGGTNINVYFSKLFVPLSFYGYNSLQKVEFPSTLGSGIFLGIQGEWRPNDEIYGASLKVLFIDTRNATAETKPLDDSLKTRFSLTSNLNYLTLSASARYNLPILGLHLYGGFDYEINTSNKFTTQKIYEYTANIDHDRNLNMSAVKQRFGIHFGIGYDIYSMDFLKMIRVNFTPFITLIGGTGILTDFGSSLNTLQARVGFSLKISHDRVRRDTLCYDSLHVDAPRYIADARFVEGIESILQYKPLPLNIMELAVVEVTQIPEEIAEASNPSVAEDEGIVNKTELPQKKTIQITGHKEFYYKSQISVALPKDTKEYLDVLAEYLKQNPNARVQIIGHSDNAGSFDEQEKRSVDRANIAYQYLIDKNISKDRLYIRGDGARVSPYPTNTVEGEAKNRRIEIIVR